MNPLKLKNPAAECNRVYKSSVFHGWPGRVNREDLFIYDQGRSCKNLI